MLQTHSSSAAQAYNWNMILIRHLLKTFTFNDCITANLGKNVHATHKHDLFSHDKKFHINSTPLMADFSNIQLYC